MVLTAASHVMWVIAYGSVGVALYEVLPMGRPIPAIVPVLVVVTLVAAIVGFVIDQKRRQK